MVIAKMEMAENHDQHVRDRTIARCIAREHLDQGDAPGWFDKLYSEADNNVLVIPWGRAAT